MVTRKEVSKILKDCGIDNKFTLRTVGFSGFGFDAVQFVEIRDVTKWTPIYGEAKAKLNAIGVVLHDIMTHG